jgi:hypothetical protein
MVDPVEQLDAWEAGEEKPMAVETIAEFEQIIDESFVLKEKIEEIEKIQIGALKTRLHDLDQKILATLQHYNKTSYRAGRGMVVKTEKFSVKFPKDPEGKRLVRDFMGEDTYSDMTSINFAVFNAWYKQKLEAAKEAGDIGFQIPGCEAPTYVEYLQRRK